MFISTTEPASGKTTGFNVEYAKEGKDKKLKNIHDSLVHHQELSYGDVFCQQDNGDLWYIEPASNFANLITQERLDLICCWDEAELIPTDEQLQQLEAIGGLPSSEYSFAPVHIEFPGRVITTKGEQIDLCIFHFSKHPPYESYFKRVLLLNEITEIKPSSLSLSHPLRIASMNVDEVRMGFWPFMVKTKNGQILTYNGITQFASTGDIKGADVVSQVEFDFEKLGQVINVPTEKITYVIGKWDESLERMWMKYKERV